MWIEVGTAEEEEEEEACLLRRNSQLAIPPLDDRQLATLAISTDKLPSLECSYIRTCTYSRKVQEIYC